jgi:hypothetical protein
MPASRFSPSLALLAFVASAACTSAATEGGNSAGALSANEANRDLVTRDGAAVPIAALAPGVEQPRVCDATPLALGEECQAANEEEITRDILASVFKFHSVQNPPSETLSKRDFHAKSTACVAARFTVSSGLPAELSQGLFATPKSYAAAIRFSNGAPASVGASGISLRPDADPDARAIAIKVTGIPGEGLLTGTGIDGEPRTQDFLLANFPVFFISNINQSTIFFKSLVTPGAHPGQGLLPSELQALAGGQTKIDNVFGERYWSQSAYRFGVAPDANGHKRAAKFSVVPIACDATAPVSFTQPPTLDLARPTDAQRAEAHFLRQTAAAQLAKGDACFAFGVQLQTDPAAMPVEDPNAKWDESASPFVEVARIRIPSNQDINDAARQAFCENQSFSPWNGTKETKPLGFINRLRLSAYSGISAKRRMENHVKLGFPSGTESFFDVVKNMR